MPIDIRSTTIIGVIHNGEAALGGDGQVTLGNTVMKHNAMKVRKIANGKVLCGFAGASADSFTLMERFEDKLEQFRGNVNRAAVELAKEYGGETSPSFINGALGKVIKDEKITSS